MPPYINSNRAARTNNTNQQPNANRQADATHGPIARAARRVGHAIVRPDDFYRFLVRGTALPPLECWRIPGSLARNMRRLNLSNKQLHSLPDHLPPNLRSLNVSNNQLQTLPNHLPKNLENLDVSRNQLQTLPNRLPQYLRILNAEENLLRKVDANIFRQAPLLNVVRLNGNPLSLQSVTSLLTRQACYQSAQIQYPNTLETYQALWQQWASEPLDAGERRDEALNKLISDSRRFRDGDMHGYTMELDWYGLRRLPPIPEGSIELTIYGNRLTRLPENLPDNLTTLNVSQNQLSSLPENLPDNLTILDVGSNQLTSLPANLPDNLTILDVGQNQLTSLPENLPDNLRELCADNNQLTSLPENLPDNLTILDVGSNQLTSLPANLPDNLTNLNVGNNPLARLPENLLDNLTKLNVSNNQLTSLPEKLPNNLKELRADNNQLTRLPVNLPSNLTHLSVSENRLTCLPENLPDNLIELRVSDNQLTRLPENLPDNLKVLLAYSNQLTRLPENLPDNLTTLDVSHNQLSSLPENLPDNLTTLHVSRNQLSSLPERLPNGLTSLWVRSNQLTRLPENLPDNLIYLWVDNNQLTHLPQNLPGTLRHLNVSRNQLREVNENLFRHLDRFATVDLRDNPLSARTFARLTAMQADPNYRGPRIQLPDQPAPEQPAQLNDWAPVIDFLRMAIDQMPFGRNMGAAQAQAIQAPPQGMPADQSANLGQAAAAWAIPPTRTNIAATTRLWQGFANEPGADEFKQFLDRLRQTVNTNDPAFQRGVAQWLTQLGSNPNLRADTFAVGIGATESCEDRISLTYNTMRKVSMAADVSRGTYDQRLPDLITLARGMFRLEKLENIARETTTELVQARDGRPIDEIEVYLGYQVMLREPLALPVDTANMAFFRTSGLTQNHLDEAQAQVQQAERQEFVTYLSTNFAPWQGVIQRLAPELHEQAQEQLIAAMEHEFTRRTNIRLQVMALHNDPDAERTLGSQVRAKIAREVYVQLTRDFMASNGMLNLLG